MKGGKRGKRHQIQRKLREGIKQSKKREKKEIKMNRNLTRKE